MCSTTTTVLRHSGELDIATDEYILLANEVACLESINIATASCGLQQVAK